MAADGGVSWTAASRPWTDTSWQNRVEMAYAPGSSNIVYASVNQSNGLIYKSTDGGRSFALVSTVAENYFKGRGNQGSYDNAIWVSPTNPDVLVVGGIELWRSRDGGQTLTKISRWDCGSEDRAKKNSLCGGALSAHADQHAIVAHPGYNGTTNRTMFFANDGGVYKTQDILAVETLSGWQELNNNLGITQFYSLAGNSGSNTLLGGTQDNGTPLNKTGNTEDWGNLYEGDGGFVAVDPANSNILYGEYVYLTMYRSTDGGASLYNIYNGITEANNPSASLFIAPFVLDPNNSNTMLAGAQSLWRSTNVKAATPGWTSIKSPLLNSQGGYLTDSSGRTIKISAISVAKGNSNVIYVGYNNGLIYKTTNGTAATPSWTRVDTDAMPARYTHRITISPHDPNVVYATFGGFSPDNIYRSTDGGATWSDRTGTGATGLPDAPVRALAVHPSNPSWLYAGTEIGVFASADGGATWNPAADGPANVSVDELIWQGQTLVAGTYGRGIFDVDTQARPANDNLANAQEITLAGNTGTASGRNVGATQESENGVAEPDHAGNAGGKSIWYKWTAPSNGTLTVDTRGSKNDAGAILDTILGVYTGSTISALKEAAPGNDDEDNPNDIITSKIASLAVTGGTTYRIAVDGYNTDGKGAVTGNVTVNLAFTSSGGPAVGLTAPEEGANVSGTSVNLAAEATDNVGVSRVDFFAGGTKVGSDTTAGGASGKEYSVSWNSTLVSDGNTAVVAKAYDAAANEGVSASRSVVVKNTSNPANNDFANALALSGTSPTANGTNVGANKEAGEPNHAGNVGGKSVWYRWTAPSNGTLIAETTGSAFNTTLGIYTGGAVNALTQVAGNDDSASGGLQSKASLSVNSGTTYQIAVDGFNNGTGAASGDLTLNLAFSSADCLVKGASGNVEGTAADNVLDGTAADENFCGYGGNDTITPAGGNDKVDGGTGSDTLSYAGATGRVSVHLAPYGSNNSPPDAFEVNGDAGIGYDKPLIGIENLTGGPHADFLYGDNNANTIAGGDGADHVESYDGNDTINARDGLVDSVINCGAGAADKAIVDELDAVNPNCETVERASVNDTTPPSTTLTAPQDGATVSGTNVNLSADATDNVGVARVEFLVNGQVANTDTSAPYLVSWDSTTVPNGSVEIKARAFDASTNEATSTARTLTVDNAQTLQTFEESDPDHAGYARWYFYRDGNLSGGRSAYATSGGSTATLKFKGTRVVWKTARFPNSGKTAVYLDGRKVKTFDAYAATPQYDVTGFAKKGLPNRRWPDPVLCTNPYESVVTDSSSFVKPSFAPAVSHEAANSAGVR